MPVRRDACFQYFSTGLFMFKRVADAKRYDTKVLYIGDVLYDSKMETVIDLFKFCNRVMYTKNRQRVYTPSVFKMLKLFYAN